MKNTLAGAGVLLGLIIVWWSAAAARVPRPSGLSGEQAAIVEHVTSAYRRAVMRPTSSDALGALGMAYHSDLLPDRAIDAYTRAAQLDPQDWRWPYYLALIEADRGHSTAVCDRLRAVVALQPDQALAWLRIGDAEFKRGRYDAAIDADERARAVNSARTSTSSSADLSHRDAVPLAAYATLHRARAALAVADVQTAASLLDTLIAAHPRFGPARRLLADALDRRGDAKGAERERRLASRLRARTTPIDPMVDALAEQSHSSTFLLKEADITDLRADSTWRLHLVRRALEVDPGSPEVVYELGTLLHELGRHEQALVEFQYYRQLVPDDDQVLTQIGRCYGEIGRFDDAEVWLRRAVEFSDDAVTIYNLGLLLEAKGRTAEAVDAYRGALGRDPKHGAAHTSLAGLLVRQGKTLEALAHFTAAADATPDDPDVHNNLGSVLAELGRFDRARAELLEALELDPTHANANANLGVLLLREGRTDEARKHFEAALAVNPKQAVALAALGR